MKKTVLLLILILAVSAAFGADVVKKSARPSGSRDGDFPVIAPDSGGGYPSVAGFQGRGLVTGSYFLGMISPDGLIARELGLTSSQKKKLRELNSNYSYKYRNDVRDHNYFTPPQGSTRGSRWNSLSLSYENAFKAILTGRQRTKYEQLKRHYTGDWYDDYSMFGDRYDYLYESAMLRNLGLTSAQKKQLENLNRIFGDKLRKQTGRTDRQKVMGEYDRSVRSMLNKKQQEMLDEMYLGFPGAVYPRSDGSFPERMKDGPSSDKKYSVR
ncbi:MAG: hypothetical protein J5758_07575 [Abditibacteriota bacterium]|nr:hypothetical protein [Abditibacteriota bacterium]